MYFCDNFVQNSQIIERRMLRTKVVDKDVCVFVCVCVCLAHFFRKFFDFSANLEKNTVNFRICVCKLPRRLRKSHY